ncbi:MAG: xanthine dehydrogenase molybdopterin binding subunit [Burkholderiales bacterium]|nr:xanthine dehydrogenase molybdopterin binding subunit [Burkholderiales bacterium]
MNAPITPTTEFAEVGVSRKHESGQLHVLGEARYTDDIPEAHGTLHAALGLSTKAHATISDIDLSAVAAAPGVVKVLTASDIIGANECGPIIHDDPILASDTVQYVGQPIFIVVAESHLAARKATRLAKISYQDLPAHLTPQQAHAAQSYVLPAIAIKRGEVEAAFASAPHIARGEFELGGQEQFYLEGQIAYALPQEDGGLLVYCSTQHPSEMQHVIAHALARHAHQIEVQCRRMGGGFGGKESQSALWAASAALAATLLQRPVKLRADRDDDMLVTGKRHCFYHAYQVAHDDEGRILGVKVEMLLRAGFSADLSGPVATRAVSHVDNGYYLNAVDVVAHCCKTNTQSNTAFRGFGCPQGAMVIEYAIDDIARNLKLDPLLVRQRNFYAVDHTLGQRNTTHYGQLVFDNVLPALVEELALSSEYQQRRKEIAAFNANSPILKKGLALTPVKFGISFNLSHLNQAGALVHVYADGSVLVNHGGTEMGQGLHTKVMQVVAHALGVNLDQVQISATNTAKIANTSATAASSGTDLNGMAAHLAAWQIRQRLAGLAAQLFGGDAKDVVFANNMVSQNGQQISFASLAQKAWAARLQLWSDGFYATPGLHWDMKTNTGSPYFYFAYGAAVSEVILDTLTGEWKCLRVDCLYDAGQSLNPALDIGQVEGGFIQGMGWLTTEQLCWNAAGKLTTHAPSTYKIPAISDCPQDFRVKLFTNRNQADAIHRSKAVGEPPLVLAFAVFFALRDAISACAGHTVNPPLQAPATCEAILQAVAAVQAASSNT